MLNNILIVRDFYNDRLKDSAILISALFIKPQKYAGIKLLYGTLNFKQGD